MRLRLPDVRILKKGVDLESKTDFGRQDIALVQMIVVAALIVTAAFLLDPALSLLYDIVRACWPAFTDNPPSTPLRPEHYIMWPVLVGSVTLTSLFLGFFYHWRHRD